MRGTPRLLAAAAAAAALLWFACVGEGRGSYRALPLSTAIYSLQLSTTGCYLLHMVMDRRGGEGRGR